MPLPRRLLLAAAAATLGVPALAASARRLAPLASMTDGPFYPERRWRERWTDWDADLTRVQREGITAPARGEHLGLDAVVVDSDGVLVDGAEVEIWQCDALAAYRHPAVPLQPGRFDPGFAGFGATRSDREGRLRLRTIRPVPYPGRTPHIHVKLRHPGFGEWTSQLFVAGEPGNERDFLWRQVPADQRAALAMQLEAAGPDGAAAGLRWTTRHRLVVPA